MLAIPSLLALAEDQEEAIFMPPALLWKMWEPEDGRPLLLAFFFLKSLGESAPHNWQTSCLLCSGSL